MTIDTTTITTLGFFCVSILCLGLFIFVSRLKGDLHETLDQKAKLEQRFAPVLDIEREAAIEQAKLEELRATYKEKKSVFDALKKQIAIFDDQMAFAELGVYEPHFEFGDSETYKQKIKDVRETQKGMVSAKTAVICHTEWTVDGNRSKGKTMTNRNIRLTLRAFNNECEAAISNTRWNNANAMIKRIKNALAQINKANESNNIIITNKFFSLKVRELRLTHEYKEKRNKEREIARESAREAREEKRLVKEAEDAKKEEEKYQALLQKAREEAGVLTREEHDQKIEEIQRLLDAAHDKSERAQAMAEKTKSGFIYIISNIGSFGSDVVKIGLTRRVDPLDRVKELGDASVPFVFDTHAIIYSDEAPALEAALHNEFDKKRINTANYRKEFFRVTLDEVEKAVARLAPDAEFHKDIEAKEFKETIAIREKALSDNAKIDELNSFPDEL